MTKTVTLHAQQKWEYLETTRKSETYLLTELNEMGQQGWELVAVTHGKDLKGDLNWTAFLKRPFTAHGHHATHHGSTGNHHSEQPFVHAPAAPGGHKVVPPAEDDGDELHFKDE